MDRIIVAVAGACFLVMLAFIMFIDTIRSHQIRELEARITTFEAAHNELVIAHNAEWAELWQAYSAASNILGDKLLYDDEHERQHVILTGIHPHVEDHGEFTAWFDSVWPLRWIDSRGRTSVHYPTEHEFTYQEGDPVPPGTVGYFVK